MNETRSKATEKRPYETAVKISISMPGILLDTGTDQMRQRGLTVFSHYVQHLIREDVKKWETQRSGQ